MAVYSGTGGTVDFGGVELIATSWTLNTSIDIVEASVLGAVAKTYVTGRQDWTATVEVIIQTITDIHALLGTAAALTLELTTSYDFTGTGYMSGLTAGGGTEDAMRGTLTFEGNNEAATITHAAV